MAPSCGRICCGRSVPCPRRLRASTVHPREQACPAESTIYSHLTRSCREQMIGLMLASTNAAEAAQAKKDDGASRPATTAAEEGSLELAAAKSGSWRRILLLVFAITLHNIPEGLAVGVRIQWHMQYLAGRRTYHPASVLSLHAAARCNIAYRSPLVAWALRLAKSSTHAASRTRLT